MFDLGIFEISLKDFNNPIISVGEASGKNALKDAVQNAIEGRDFILKTARRLYKREMNRRLTFNINNSILKMWMTTTLKKCTNDQRFERKSFLGTGELPCST